MSDLISRQALCEYALNQKDKSITPNDIMRFPSAEPAKHAEWVSFEDYKKALDCILEAYLNPEIRHDILEKFVFETFSVGEVKSDIYER